MLYSPAAEECMSRALPGTTSDFIDRFRTSYNPSISNPSSRATSLAPSKLSRQRGRTIVPRTSLPSGSDNRVPNAITPASSSIQLPLDSSNQFEDDTSLFNSGAHDADGGKVGDESASHEPNEDRDQAAKDTDSEKSSKSDDEDEESEWDNGEPLTLKERAKIMKLCTYERR